MAYIIVGEPVEAGVDPAVAAEKEEAQRKTIRRGPAPENTLADYGKDLKSAAEGLVGSVNRTGAWLKRKMAEGDENAAKTMGRPEFMDEVALGRESARILDERAKRWEDASEATTKTKTLAGQNQTKASFFADEGGEAYSAADNITGYLGSNTVRSVPALVVSAVPGTLFGKLMGLGGRGLAMLGTALGTGTTNAAINTGDVLGSIASGINEYSDAELIAESPVYKRLRADDIPEAEAKQQLIELISDKPAIITGLVSAATGMFGAEATLAKSMTGDMVKKGFLKGLLLGIPGEGGTEAIESGQQEASTQTAFMDAGTQDGLDWGKIAEAGFAGFTLGGVMGGVIGGATNITRQKKVPVVPVAGPDATETAGLKGEPVAPATPPVEPAVPPPVVVASKQPKGNANAPAPTTVETTAATGPDAELKAGLTAAVATPAPPAAPPVVAPPVIRKNAQRPPVPVGTPNDTAPVAAEPVVPPPPAPPPVTQDVIPPPPGAENAPVVAPPVMPPPVSTAPVDVPDQNLSIPPDTLPPDYGPPESQPLPPTVEEDPPEPAATGANPRVLVDLEAQKRLAAQQAEQVTFEEGRGVDYAKGIAPDDFDNPEKHRLWRKRMQAEAAGPAPSEIAKRFAGLARKGGGKMTLEQKVANKALHAEWIDTQLKARAEAEAAAKAAEPQDDPDADRAADRALLNKVLRRMAPPNAGPAYKKQIDKMLENFDNGLVSRSDINELWAFAGLEADLDLGSRGGFDTVEAQGTLVASQEDSFSEEGDALADAAPDMMDMAEEVVSKRANDSEFSEKAAKNLSDGITAGAATASALKEAENAVVTRVGKGAADAPPTFGKASEGATGLASKFTAEDKARMAAEANAKWAADEKRGKNVPEATAKEAKVEKKFAPQVEPKVTQQVSKKAEAKTPAPKPAAPKSEKAKAVSTKRAADRAAALNAVGERVLWLRRKARDVAKTNGPDSEIFQELQKDIRAQMDIVKEDFGKAAVERTTKQVEAMLAADSKPKAQAPKPMQKPKPMSVFSELDIDRQEAEGLFDDDTTVEELTQFLKPDVPVKMAVNFNTSQGAVVLQSFTVKDALAQAATEKVRSALTKRLGEVVSSTAMAGYKAITEKLTRLAGDVKIVVISDDSFKALYPPKPGTEYAGVYDPNTDQIVIPGSLLYDDVDWVAHVMIHEAAHAAYQNALNNDPVFRESLEAVMERMAAEYDPDMRKELGIDYAFTNIDEFLSELLSNPRLQDAMASTPMDAKTSKDMGFVPGLVSNLWSAFVRAARLAAGISPKDVSALEAALRIVSKADKSAVQGRQNARARAAVFADTLPNNIILAQRRPDMATQEVQAMLVPKLQAAAATASPKRLRNAMFNLMTLDDLVRYASKFYPKEMTRKVYDIVGMKRKRAQQLNAEATVITDLHKAQKAHKGDDHWVRFINTAMAATTHGIHPDVPLKDPKNAHVKKSAKWMQVKMAHAELSKEWQKLPADLKKLWRDTAKFPETRQNTVSLLMLESIVETALDRKDKQLAKRIFNGVMTDADRDLFKTNTAMKVIANAAELKKLDGVYFPKMRHGNFVVTGEYQMPAQYKKFAKTSADGDTSYQFEDSKEAGAFAKDMLARGIHTKLSVYTIDATTNAMTYTYVDPATGQYITNPDGSKKQFRFAKGDTGTKTIIKAVAQTKLVKFYDTDVEANTDRALLAEEGEYGETLSGVMQKTQLQHGDARVSSRNMINAMNAMEKGAGYKKLSDAQKKVVRQTILEMSLNFLSSTAPQQRSRVRRNVLGESADITRNMAEYAAVTSRVIANLEYQPELDAALDAMEKHSDSLRYTDTVTSLPRTQVLEAIHKNIDYQTGGEPTKLNRFTNVLLAMSFLDKLVSPAYHMVNSLQTPMVAAPVMGGRHGFARTTYELVKSYKDIGAYDVLKTGTKDTKKALTDYLEGTTDYIADMRKKLAKQPDGKELADMLDYLAERGAADKDTGMEISDLVGNATKFEGLLHRSDHVVRQFGTAVEIMNRTTTAVAAFRMERARGASIQEATVYAQETVLATQGDYSTTNSAIAFRHPLARVILQFKKYAQLQYSLLAKLTYNSFKGATRQEKYEAAKSLTGLLVSHAAMAGALGLPTEPIKITFMILSTFLPMPEWEEIEGDITKFAQEFLGDSIGDAVTHGLPRLVGIDLHSRVGQNSLALFGEPRSADTEGVQAYLWRTVMGAPIGLVTEKAEGLNHIKNGEYGKAWEKLAPIKVLSDSIKAYRLATEGKVNKRGESTMDPLSIPQAVGQAMGFTPAEMARKDESRNLYEIKKERRRDARQTLLDAFKQAKPNERAKIRRDILRYNATVPPNARIALKTLSNMLKRDETAKNKGYLKNGVYSGAINKDLADEYLGD